MVDNSIDVFELMDSKYILSPKNVTDIRGYIQKKYPYTSSKKKAVIFADTVNKIIERQLLNFTSQNKAILKEQLYRNAVSKEFFYISTKDVFYACADIKDADQKIIDELESFLGINFGVKVPEKILEFFNKSILSVDSIDKPSQNLELKINVQEDINDLLPDIDYTEYINDVLSNEFDFRVQQTISNEEVEAISFEELPDEEVQEQLEIINCLTTQSVPELEGQAIDIQIKKSKVKYINFTFVLNSEFIADFIAKHNVFKLVPDLSIYVKSIKSYIRDIKFNKYSIFDKFTAMRTKILVTPFLLIFIGIPFICGTANNIILAVNNEDKSGYADTNIQKEAVLKESSVNPDDIQNNVNDMAKRQRAGKYKEPELDTNKSLGEIKQDKKMDMIATAYDLSYDSCGKSANDPQYGITSLGIRAKKGRTIAVDPSVIPLGSKVYVVFPHNYSYLDGIYQAEEVSSFKRSNMIDIFLGEDEKGNGIIHDEVKKFGLKKVEVYIQ